MRLIMHLMHRLRFTLLILLALLIAGCGVLLREPGAIEPITSVGVGEGRTFYESLDLSTPETAAATFVAAFQRNDFMTVYLVLSYDAQFEFQRSVALFRYDDFIRLPETEDGERPAYFDEIPVFGTGLGRAVNEHSPAEAWYVFDGLMLVAAENDALPIDLTGGVAFGSRRSAIAVPRSGDDLPAVDVAARVEGIDGDVIFRMTQSMSGRWRVFQVIVPGGNEERIPWSVVTPPEAE
ncbi:MAG: hypothetical protein GYB67_18525 [Chloroflexi bacterium]|nr:hypothetical protein [Chloroflexota bacterium]